VAPVNNHYCNPVLAANGELQRPCLKALTTPTVYSATTAKHLQFRSRKAAGGDRELGDAQERVLRLPMQCSPEADA